MWRMGPRNALTLASLQPRSIRSDLGRYLPQRPAVITTLKHPPFLGLRNRVSRYRRRNSSAGDSIWKPSYKLEVVCFRKTNCSFCSPQKWCVVCFHLPARYSEFFYISLSTMRVEMGCRYGCLQPKLMGLLSFVAKDRNWPLVTADRTSHLAQIFALAPKSGSAGAKKSLSPSPTGRV